MALPSSLLNQSASLARVLGQVRDGRGGWHDAAPTVVGFIPVRIQPASSSEVIAAGQRGARVTHKGFALTSADIRRGDFLSIDQTDYQVEMVTTPSDPTHHVVMLLTHQQRAGKPL